MFCNKESRSWGWCLIILAAGEKGSPQEYQHGAYKKKNGKTGEESTFFCYHGGKKIKDTKSVSLWFMAERAGFEPANPCGLHTFQACALGQTTRPLHMALFQRRELYHKERKICAKMMLRERAYVAGVRRTNFNK